MRSRAIDVPEVAEHTRLETTRRYRLPLDFRIVKAPWKASTSSPEGVRHLDQRPGGSVCITFRGEPSLYSPFSHTHLFPQDLFIACSP